MLRSIVHQLAGVLARGHREEVAALLGLLAGAETDGRLSDRQADLADALFDALAELRPECVRLASR